MGPLFSSRVNNNADRIAPTPKSATTSKYWDCPISYGEKLKYAQEQEFFHQTALISKKEKEKEFEEYQHQNMACDDQMVKVIGDRFCVPYTLQLIVKRRVESFSNAHYDVFDTTGNCLLQVDGGVWQSPKKRVMIDPSGLPAITMRAKGASWIKKWLIHEGESSEPSHFLCSVQRPNALSIMNNLDVYLASTYKEDGPDFHVTGSFTSLSFKVWHRKSIIAEVKHNYTWESCKGKESFKVKVYPEVDYAFILALIVIMHDIDRV